MKKKVHKNDILDIKSVENLKVKSKGELIIAKCWRSYDIGNKRKVMVDNVLYECKVVKCEHRLYNGYNLTCKIIRPVHAVIKFK